jgi:carbonic anhydrase
VSTLDTAHVVDEFLASNATFADTHQVAGLPMLPTGRTIIVGCVDPRVDPALVMGLDLGEAAVIRNIGGRITPATLRTLALLAAITRSTGTRPGDDWNLVLVPAAMRVLGRAAWYAPGVLRRLSGRIAVSET